MRTLSIALLLLLVSSNVVAQNIYHDTQRLSKYLTEEGKFTDTTGTYIYTQILRSYLPDSLAGDEDFKPKDVVAKFTERNSEYYNPILENYLPDLDAKNDTLKGLAGQEKIQKVKEGKIDALGGFNVTTIADGIAKFLVKRANEELSIAFFNRFKKEIRNNIELQTLFPTTEKLLLRLDPLQYSYMLNALKEAFQKDISKLVVHIEDLVETPKYKRLINNNEDLKFIYLGIEAAQIVHKLSKGGHPADVIEGLGKSNNVDKFSSNLASGLKVISLLSSSIRDITDGSTYVSAQELKENVFDSTVTRDIFLGLLYQRSLEITFDRKDEKDPISFAQVIKSVADNTRQFETIYSNLLTHYEPVQNRFKAVEKKSPSERSYVDYHEFFVTLPNFIASGFEELEPLLKSDTTSIKEFGDELERYLRIAEEGGDIVKNVHDKKYASAIVNLVEIYDDAIGINVDAIREKQEETLKLYMFCVDNVEKCANQSFHKNIKEKLTTFLDDNGSYFNYITFKDLVIEKSSRETFRDKIEKYFEKHVFLDKGINKKLMKYGLFIANVAQAENSDQVQAAIEAVVLPAGSSRIKRVSKWNVSVNAYLGAFGGREKLRENNEYSGNFGVFAPIGIALSKGWGYGEINKKSVNSVSLFISAIDLGALTSYRIKDKKSQLPEFTLENIVAPGAYGVWNIGGTPISLMGGVQLGPQLRKIDTDSPTLTETSAWRWQVAVSVDIPLFNLGTVPWN